MKIGVIVAMGKELDLLLPLMENASELQINGFTFYCGNIGRAEIVAMKKIHHLLVSEHPLNCITFP